MVNFSALTVLCAVLQFAALPALLERIAKVLFARLRPHLSAADRGVLSQRFGRAMVALMLAQGGARAMLAQGRMTMRGTTAVGQYYMLGCVVFYIFDSVSYTHLDVYKRQVLQCSCRSCTFLQFLQFL